MKHLMLLLLAAAVMTPSVSRAQVDVENWERYYECRLANGTITVDGVGNELAWQIAPEVGEFTRFQKKGELTVTHRTTAKMLWDDTNLYLLISVEDPDIWSTMTVRDRDCLCKEETIELFIDPDGDGVDYAEIHINCLDTINDIRIPRKTFKNADGSPVDWTELYGWTQEGMLHAVMNYGTVNDRTDEDLGSVFEFALPWDGFGRVGGAANLPPEPGDVWRININRYERTRAGASAAESGDAGAELSAWAPLMLHSYHVPERFGFVTFVPDH